MACAKINPETQTGIEKKLCKIKHEINEQYIERNDASDEINDDFFLLLLHVCDNSGIIDEDSAKDIQDCSLVSVESSLTIPKSETSFESVTASCAET